VPVVVVDLLADVETRRMAEKLHLEFNDGIEVVSDVGGNKGRGVVSTRDLALGARVMSCMGIKIQLREPMRNMDLASGSFAHSLLRDNLWRPAVLSFLCDNPERTARYAKEMKPENAIFEQTRTTRMEWFRAISAIRTNAWADKDEEGRVGALFLNIFGSLFNHSCLPNAHLDCDGQGARLDHVDIIGPVVRGSEITFSYPGLDFLLRPPSLRRSILQTVWGFVCACERCVGELAKEEEVLLASGVPDILFKAWNTLIEQPNVTVAEDTRLATMALKLVSPSSDAAGAWTKNKFDWRASLMRRELVSLVMPATSATAAVLRAHWLTFVGQSAAVMHRFLSPLSIFKERLYNEAMRHATTYGFTKRQVWDVLRAQDESYTLPAFAKLYTPETSPSLFA